MDKKPMARKSSLKLVCVTWYEPDPTCFIWSRVSLARISGPGSDRELIPSS